MCTFHVNTFVAIPTVLAIFGWLGFVLAVFHINVLDQRLERARNLFVVLVVTCRGLEERLDYANRFLRAARDDHQ